MILDEIWYALYSSAGSYYTVLWPLVFSLLASFFVSWSYTSVPKCLPYVLRYS